MAKIKQVVVNNFSYPFSGSNYLSINSNGVINVNAAEIYGTTYDGKYLISLSYLTDYVDAALASITPGGGGGETTNWLSSDSITPNYTTQKLNVNKQWVISTVLKDGDWNNISVSNQSKLSSMISSWGFRTSTTDSDTLYGVTVNGGILLSGQTNSTRQFYIDTEWLDTQFNTNVSGLVKSYLLSVDTPHTAGEVLKINANNDGFEWGTAGISEVNLSDVASDASAGSVIVVGSNGKLTASNDIYPLSTVASIYDIVKQIIKIDTANSHAGFTLDPNATAHTLTFTDTGDGSGSSGGGQQYTSLDTKVITVNNNSFKIGITAGSAAGQILSTMNNGGTLSAVWGTPNFLTAGDLYSSTKKLDASSISSATKPGYFKFDSDGNASIVNETYLTTDGLTQANIYDAVAAIIQKGTSHGGFDITKNPTAKTITITDAGDGSGGGGKTEDNVSTSGTTTTIGVKTDWLNGQILSYLSTLTHSSTNNTLKINDSNVVYWGQDYGGTGGDGNTTYTIVAGNSTGTKAVTNNGNSYITVKGSDGNNTQFVISGTQNVSVATDENGNVTITGPNLADYFSTVSDFIDLTNKGYLIKVNSAGTGLDYVNYSTWKLTDTNSTYSAADTSLTFNPASQTAGSNTTIKVSEAWLTGKISSYLSGLDGAAAGQVLKINDNNNGFVWATVTQGGGADGNDWYKYSAADTSLTFNPTGSTNKGTTTIAVNTTWLAGWLNDNGYADTNDHMSTYMYANTDWNGTGTPINSSTDVSDPYIFLVEKYGSTNTKTNSIQIKAGTDISVKAKNGVITIGFTNGSGYQTTNTQYNLLVDKSQTTNGNVYIRLKDTAAAATTYVNSYKISGAQNVKVTSDSDGNITITGPDLTNYKTEDHDHTYSNGDTSLTFTPGSNETATVIVNTTWLEGFLTDNNYTINSDISGLVKEYLSGITGHAANKILKINSSNNDFEWVTPDSGGDITSTYLLSNVTGKGAGKVLKINSSNNGLVWANDEVGQSGSSDGNTTYSNGTGITLTGADADIDFGGNFSINTEWLDTYLNGKNYLTDHWVHYLRVNQGGANTIVGQQTSNTNTYLRLIENGSPVADKIQLSGGGTVSVSATSAGVITLSGKQYKLIVNDDLGTASKTNASNPYIILNQDGTNVNDKVRLSGGTNIDISNTLANNVNTITISFNNPGYITSYTQMSSYLRVNYNGTDTTSKSNTTTYKDVYIVLNQGGTNREDKIKLVGTGGVSISNSYNGTNKINTITITGPNLSEYKKDHLTANLWVGWNGTGTPANPTTDVSNPCIILTEKEGSTYTIRDGIKLQGSGATTVKAKNGIVTINSTDHTYEDDNRLTQLTGANSNVFTIRPGANNQILSTTLVGSTTSAGWVNTPAWKTTDNDTKYQNETDDTSLIFGVNGTQTVNAWNAIKVNTTWLNTQIGNYITTNNIPTSDTNTRYKLVSVVSQDASTASKIPTIKLQSSTDGSTYSDQNTYKISGQNNVKVTSDSNGNIIIDGTHTHTFDHYNSYLYVGAKDGTANGTTNNTTDTYLLHVENGVNNSQVKLAGTNINISSNGGTLTLSGAAPYVIGSDNTKYDFFAAGNGYAAGDSKDSVNGATTLHLSGSDSTWDKVVISGQDGIEVGSNSAGNIILTGTYGLNVGKQSTSDPYPSIRLTTSNNVKDFITISGFNGISAGYGNTNLGLTIDETWFHDRMITANITYQSTLETLRQEIFAENGDAFHNKLYLVPSITNIQATSAGNYSMRTAILDNIYQAKIPGYKTYSAKTDGSDPVVTAYVTVMDEDYYNGIRTDGYRTIRDVVAKLLTNGAYRGDIDINQISGFANSKQNSTVSDSIYTTMSSTTLNGHAQSQMRYASESTVFKLEVNPWWLLDTLQTNIFKSFPDYSDNTEPVFSSVVRMNRHSLKSIDYQEYLNWSQDHGTVVGEYDGNPIIEYPHHGDMAFQGTHWTEVPQFYLSSYQLDNHGHHSLMIFPTWFGENMSAHLSNDSGLSCRSDLLTTTLQDNTIRHDYHYTHNFGIDANWVTNNCVKTQEVSSWIETTLSTIQGRVGKYTGTTTIALNYNTGDFLTGATINASRNTQLTVSNIPIGRGIIARFDFTAAAVGNKLRFGASNSDDYNILVVPEAGTYYIGFVRYNNSTNIQCIGVRKILGVKALS